MAQFHETEFGRRFFGKQLPDLTKAIGDLNDSVKRLTSNVQYVCSEEYDDPTVKGNPTRIYKTAEEALAWVLWELSDSYGCCFAPDMSTFVLTEEQKAAGLLVNILEERTDHSDDLRFRIVVRRVVAEGGNNG